MTASVSTLAVAAAQTSGARVSGLAARLAALSRRSVASARSLAFQTAGLAFIDYAVFQWHQVAGYAAVGVSLFVMDFITGGGTAAQKGDGSGGEVPR